MASLAHVFVGPSIEVDPSSARADLTQSMHAYAIMHALPVYLGFLLCAGSLKRQFRASTTDLPQNSYHATSLFSGSPMEDCVAVPVSP